MRTTTKQRAGDAKKLRKLPAVAAKAVVDVSKRARTPKKVVASVQDELARLLARGYSVAEVGAVLRGAGIEVAAGTLRSYARSVKQRAEDTPRAAATKRKVATRRATNTTATTATTAPPATTATIKKSGSTTGAVSTASRKSTPPPAAPAKGRAPVAKPAASPAPGRRDFHLAKATFVVRPDTPDSDL